MCFISDKLKIIYVAIPKTGTRSTEEYLKSLPNRGNIRDFRRYHTLDPHCYAKTIKNKVNNTLQNNYDDYYSFTVVRNPFDWYVSWYTYRQRPGSRYKTNDMTFKEYLEKQPMEDMIDFISDDDDNIIVDKVIRFEDGIEDEVKKILLDREIIHPETFKYLNKSDKRQDRPYQDFYDEETIKMVEKYQAKTLKMFNYSFEEKN